LAKGVGPRSEAPRAGTSRDDAASLGIAVQSERYDSRLSIASVPATARHKRVALAFSIGVLVAFAVLTPFALVPLPRSDGFIPALQAIVAATDFITAVLLFAQYTTDRSRALLVLAAGYLFVSLIVVAHTLAFPGAFTPTGLLGAGPQTSAWLYVVWHVSHPSAIIGYVLLQRPGTLTDTPPAGPTTAIRWTVAAVVASVAVFTWIAVAGEGWLPTLIVSERGFNTSAQVVTALALVASVAAFLLLWGRRRSVLDEWLLVALSASIAETATIVFVGASRYTVSFYVGKPFGVLASCAVLVALLSEMTSLYVRLALAVRALQRERASKVLNLDLIVGSIAHQVKQPLTVITTCSTIVENLLRKPTIDVGKVQLNVDDIAQAGLNVADTIDSMRTLLKNPNEAQQRIDVNAIVLEALTTLVTELSDRQISVETDLATDLPAVIGHRGQLREVFLNIVQNAIEAMATTAGGTRRLRVETRNGATGRVSVAIEDSGPGIDPDRLPSLLTAFVTTKPGGMGLGLGICQMIVDRHNGELAVTSELGKGTRFRVVLPAEAGATFARPFVTAASVKAEA
jgi:signal transduction histidine kinase